jgi:hypothetical protein
MPYRLDWEVPWGLCVRFAGTVTPAEVAALNREVTSSEHWDNLRYAVGDFTGAADFAFDPGDPRSYVDPHALLIGAGHSNARYHVAVVAPDERFEKPLRMAIEAGVYPARTGFFRTEPEARDWLAAQTMSYRPPTKK